MSPGDPETAARVATFRDSGEEWRRLFAEMFGTFLLVVAWAHSTYERNLLEPGDLDEALAAAGAAGDDLLQQLGPGQVEPEKWTYGSSAQRQQWLVTGFDSGRPADCNTFTGSI